MRDLTWQDVLFAAAVGLVLAYGGWYLAHHTKLPAVQDDKPARNFSERFDFGPRPVRVIEMTKHEPAKEPVPDAAPPAFGPKQATAPLPSATLPSLRTQAQIAAAEVPKQARDAVDICSRHHMRRVERGRGWRCRK